MKKLRLAILVTLCFAVMGLCAACTTSVKYYDLTYKQQDGVTFVSEVKDGARVKQGYDVGFKVEIDWEKVTGEAKVTANGKELKASEDGVYTFTMNSDTVIEVEGIFARAYYDITFDSGEFRTRYEVDGKDVSGETVRFSAGADVKFSVTRSVYLTGEPSVEANTTILMPDSDGYYTLSVTEKTTVSVSGLTYPAPFYHRADGGDGTAANPYKITNAYDLLSMGYAVSSTDPTDEFLKYAYYELANDIDMNGEQMFVIGNDFASGSYFGGHFNGNGHTISNYYIEDYVIDQSTFLNISLPYLGLFGYVNATSFGPAEISNLNLKNFTINADFERYDVDKIAGEGETQRLYAYTVGGLVGYGVGVNIVGCSVEGDITVKSSKLSLTYAGGLAGVISSLYSSNGIEYYSEVRSCSASVGVKSTSGYGYATGGLVGYLMGMGKYSPAYVANSYATGDVSGGIFSGGLVGLGGTYTSVLNSYSLGSVSAYGSVKRGDALFENNGYANDDYAVAYAGGVVGHLKANSLVYRCFTKSTVSAECVNAGKDYALTGGISAYYAPDRSQLVQLVAAYEYECYDALSTQDIDAAFLKNTLKWQDIDWIFTGEYPTINHEASEGEYSYDVNIVYVDNSGSESAGKSVTVTDTYLPMGAWYAFTDEIEEFFTDGYRSYGYYFDEGLVHRVPEAFVPCAEITLYAGFTDYTDVAGRYYLSVPGSAGSGAYVELSADGNLFYRNGGVHYESYYSYDGEKITLWDTLVSDVAYSVTFVSTFEATVSGDEMSIYDNNFLSYGVSLTAAKMIDGFAYGTYYLPNGASFTFNPDHTGSYVSSSGTVESLTYIRKDSGNLEVKYGSTTREAAVSGGYVTEIGGQSVTPRDPLAGRWETASFVSEVYDIDGKGGFAYERFTFGEDGAKVTSVTKSGTYVYSGGEAVLTTSDGETLGTLSLGDGNIYLDGEALYAENSYCGTWLYNAASPIDLTLYGIGTDGYGKAFAMCGTDLPNYELTYDTDADGKINLYYGYESFGTLEFSKSDGTLVGEIYYPAEEKRRTGAKLCRYDDYKGLWITDFNGIESLEFDGLGAYDLAGAVDNYLPVSGGVKINGTDYVGYSLAYGSNVGAFTYDGVEYAIETDGDEVTIAPAGGTAHAIVKYDELRLLTLATSDGSATYSFDGRGYLSGGGTVTAVEAGVTTEYGYTVSGGVITLSGSLSGTITAEDKAYKLTLGGTTRDLYVSNGFTGEWIVGRTDGEKMTVGTVGADLKAEGTFRGDEITYSYDYASGVLSFRWNGINITGTLNVATEEGVNIAEIGLKVDGEVISCIKETYVDEYRGTYVSDSATVVLDGLSKGRFARGTALIVENGETYAIPYKINRFGDITFGDKGIVSYIFALRNDGSGAFGGNGKTYDLVEPNIFYTVHSYGINIFGQLDEEVNYYFDGMETVYDENNEVLFSYELLEQTNDDVLRLVYRLVLTDGAGKVYDAELDYGSTDYVMTYKPRA